jgi:DNA-binding response OmpR family regulator
MPCCKVAVVDDDRAIREALRDALEQAGFDVHVVPNGLKLMSVLSVVQPDIILLDVMMSWIDGVDLCCALKQNDAYSDIPVVFMSARTSPEDVRRGMSAGAADYIKKPFDLDRLLDRLQQLSGEVRARAETQHA